MSIADQQKFLTSFDKKLQRKVASYRRMKANRQHHIFLVTSKAITKGITDTLTNKLAGRKNSGKIISKVLKKANFFGYS